MRYSKFTLAFIAAAVEPVLTNSNNVRVRDVSRRDASPIRLLRKKLKKSFEGGERDKESKGENKREKERGKEATKKLKKMNTASFKITDSSKVARDSSRVADFWYADYDTAWDIATCLNELPLPMPRKEDRPSYDTMLKCCEGAYGNQISGACLANRRTPPAESPTGVGPANSDSGTGYYGNPSDWDNGVCTNKRPLPETWLKLYDTEKLCCAGDHKDQTSHVCMCNADPCYSCKCTGPGSWEAIDSKCDFVCE